MMMMMMMKYGSLIMSHIVGKTDLLYITVNKRSSSKLRNDAAADVITDYYGGRLVIIVTTGGCRLLQPAGAVIDWPEQPEHLFVTPVRHHKAVWPMW